MGVIVVLWDILWEDYVSNRGENAFGFVSRQFLFYLYHNISTGLTLFNWLFLRVANYVQGHHPADRLWGVGLWWKWMFALFVWWGSWLCMSVFCSPYVGSDGPGSLWAKKEPKIFSWLLLTLILFVCKQTKRQTSDPRSEVPKGLSPNSRSLESFRDNHWLCLNYQYGSDWLHSNR